MNAVIATILFFSTCSFNANAETTQADKKVNTAKAATLEAGRDAKRGVKKTARKVEDKACEMINGKLECAAKKVKHGVQNAADNVEDALD